MKYIIILLMIATSMLAKEYIETETHYATYETFAPEVNDSYDTGITIRLAMPKQHTNSMALLMVDTKGKINLKDIIVDVTWEDESVSKVNALSGTKKDGTFGIAFPNKDVWMLMCKKIMTIDFMYAGKQYIFYFDQQKRNKMQYTLHNLFIDNWK